MVPFTLVGGIAALAFAGLHLSVSAAVGFIAVAGISVQNGVIMVEHIVERLRDGAAFATAVTEGAVARLRPILMTALMAGLGLLPAALSHGIGSETQRPFAVVIVGGIVSGTLFTLLLLPLFFARFGREDAGAGDAEAGRGGAGRCPLRTASPVQGRRKPSDRHAQAFRGTMNCSSAAGDLPPPPEPRSLGPPGCSNPAGPFFWGLYDCPGADTDRRR